MNRAEVENMLARVIDAESEVGITWWPGTEMAPVVYRRWHSFSQRNRSKHPTRDMQFQDLAKGIEAAFNPTGLYLAPSDSMHLARLLADVLDNSSLPPNST